MRLFAFVLSLLLLAGAIEPSKGWLIALVVVTGLAATKLHHFRSFRPSADAALAAFVLAVLLLAGTIAPSRDWLIGLTAVTGVAAFAPKRFRLDGFCAGGDGHGRRFDWDRREQRRDRRWRRYTERFGDEW